ncbi:MAG: cysteine desulfurase family protein [Ignavibacteriaceae bacterium]|nr:cysteine desulfurase family protein [Ignavibacteriaceae bacterium]
MQSNDKIYLDNAATTPVDPRVFEAMQPYLTEIFGNPSSIHQYGKIAKVMLEDTRDLIAEFIRCKPKEIFFTSGGTESINTFLKGISLPPGEKNCIITSSIEHMAVLETMNYLNKNFNVIPRYVKPERNGSIDPGEVLDLLDEATIAVSIMHVNNETGVKNDIKKIAEHCKSKNIPFHSDTVQSFGKMDINVKELGVDSISASAHKIYGPKGIGFIYVNENIRYENLLHGGSQERNKRGGTENIPAIAGFQKAVEILKSEMENDIKHYKTLHAQLMTGLNDFSQLFILNSSEYLSVPNIVSISFYKSKINFDSETLFMKLDIDGVAVSGGSACTSGSLKPSHVMQELGHDNETAMATIRISLGRFNTPDDIVRFVKLLKKASGLL